MKLIKYMLAAGAMAVLMVACSENDNYENRVFKQYLINLVRDTRAMALYVVEGDDEGQYMSGAREVLNIVADEGENLYYNPNTSQAQVDDYCTVLKEAAIEFEDKMHPFLSRFDILAANTEYCISTTQVGEGEGMIGSQADVDTLRNELTWALDTLQFIGRDVIRQRQLDVIQSRLTNSLYAFESKIPGKVNIQILNPSFEPEGNDAEMIEDFAYIPDWNNQGPLNNFDPWGVNELIVNTCLRKDGWQVGERQNVDGNYVMYIMNYAKRVWQLTNEGVHPNVTYTLTVNASQFDWQNAENVKLLMELVVFDDAVGNFNKASVVASQEFNNIDMTDFVPYTMECSIPSDSPYTGKVMAICFRSYVGTVAESTEDDSFEWDSSGVMIDLVSMTRKSNK